MEFYDRWIDKWPLFIHIIFWATSLWGHLKNKKENYMLCKYNLNLKIENDFYYNF